MERETPAVSLLLKIREADRLVEASGSDTVRMIKQKEFPHQRVRLICCGRELDDDMTVRELEASYGSAHRATGANIIVHCVLSTPLPAHGNPHTPGGDRDDALNAMDECGFLKLLMGACCLLFWMVYFSIPELFQVRAVLLLTTLTVAYALFVIISNATPPASRGGPLPADARPESVRVHM